MTKENLVGALNNVLNNYIFGMVLTRIVPADALEKTVNKKATFQGPAGELLHVDLTPLTAIYSNPSDKKILSEEFEKSLKRSLLGEAHEIICWYCEETKQHLLYESQPWYQFARIIRNSVSHKQGGTLHPWPSTLSKKGITQVCWRTRSLDISLVGKEILFTHQEALQLFSDIMDFAKTTLK